MSFAKPEMQQELLEFLTSFRTQILGLYGDGETARGTDDPSIQISPLWKALDEMYDYGVQGVPTGGLGPGNRINGTHAEAENFFRAIDTRPMRRYLDAAGNKPPRLAALTVQCAVARMVLDGGDRFTDFGADQHGFGNGDSGYLTLAEVAVLANMDERSVRNAANPKLPSPLKTEQVGNRSLVRPEEGRRWLAGRKGFLPTQEGVAFTPSKLPEWDLTLPPELFEKLQREADIEHEKTGELPSIYMSKKILEILARAARIEGSATSPGREAAK